MKLDPLSRQILRIVITHGKDYESALLPDDIEPGPLGQCYDWCFFQAVKNRKYRYVEGLAIDPRNGEVILHAWLTDGIYAFDPTWHALDEFDKKVPIPYDYLGIEMDILHVHAFMKSTGYQGVLGNRWRNPGLAHFAYAGTFETDSEFPAPKHMSLAMKLLNAVQPIEKMGTAATKVSGVIQEYPANG